MGSVDVLAKLPLINAYSKQLKLTLLTEEDKALYCTVMAEPGCMQYIGKLLPQADAGRSFAAAVKLNNQHPLKRIYLRASLLSSDQSIGIASINKLDIANKSADIGRMLLPQWQGKGLGSELSRMLIKWLAAELGAVSITKHIRADNTAAIKSALKLGFSATTVLPLIDKDGIARYQLGLA